MARVATLILLGFLIFVPANLQADNWPQFRGPGGAGAASGGGIPSAFSEKEGILWKVAVPGLGNSSPVVWDESLFLQTSSTDGKSRLLLCLDARSGKETWSRSLPAARAHAHPKNSLASCTPATDGVAVFTPVWDGKEVTMVAYSVKGDFLWKRNLGPFISQHGPGASPILFKEMVIYANDMDQESKDKKQVNRPAILMALAKKDGEVVWETPRVAHRACYSAPFILEKPKSAPELIVTSTTAVTSYNPIDGAKNWEWTWKFKGMQLRTVASTLLVDDTLCALAGDGSGDRHAVGLTLAGQGKSTKVAQAWENRKDFPYVPCILSRDGFVYFVNDGGFAGCYEAKSGKRIWYERQPDAEFTASPVMIDSRMFAASEQGDVYVFSAETKYNLLARNNLGERVRATPAVANGRLYIRGQNHLFCIGKK